MSDEKKIPADAEVGATASAALTDEQLAEVAGGNGHLIPGRHMDKAEIEKALRGGN